MVELKDLKWIKADEIPGHARSPGMWRLKLQEFLDGPHDIAFLQASDINEMKRFAGGLRSMKKRFALTRDNIRISENKEQLRVYVAKRLVPKPEEGE